jgi:hypothetical protein
MGICAQSEDGERVEAGVDKGLNGCLKMGWAKRAKGSRRVAWREENTVKCCTVPTHDSKKLSVGSPVGVKP